MTILSPAEYAPFYQGYIDHVDASNIQDALSEQLESMSAFLETLTDEQASFRYASDKWSVKEVIGHLSDTERVMSYRALAVARGDQRALPGFDQNQYVTAANFDNRSLASLVEEWEAVRNASIAFFRHVASPDDERSGTVNDHPMSVRALAYIVVGHTVHHRKILAERYHL